MSHNPPRPPPHLWGKLSDLVEVKADLLVTCRACRHVSRLNVLDVL